MDDRDKEDAEEWLRRHEKKKKTEDKPEKRKPATTSKPKEIDWSGRLGREYFFGSLGVWGQRLLSLALMAGIVAGLYSWGIPAINDYSGSRYSKYYKSPIYLCSIPGLQELYQNSPRFFDYYNFRRFEIRLYQHAAWDVDGEYRLKYPDKAFVIHIPPMPDDYTADSDLAKYPRLNRINVADSYIRSYYRLTGLKVTMTVIDKGEQPRCKYSDITPQKMNGFTITHNENELICKSCTPNFNRDPASESERSEESEHENSAIQRCPPCPPNFNPVISPEHPCIRCVTNPILE